MLHLWQIPCGHGASNIVSHTVRTECYSTKTLAWTGCVWRGWSLHQTAIESKMWNYSSTVMNYRQILKLRDERHVRHTDKDLNFVQWYTLSASQSQHFTALICNIIYFSVNKGTKLANTLSSSVFLPDVIDGDFLSSDPVSVWENIPALCVPSISRFAPSAD